MKFLLNDADASMNLVTQEGPLQMVVRQPGRPKAVHRMLVILFAGYLAFPLFIQGPPPSQIWFWGDLLLWDFALGLFPWLIFLSLRLWAIPMELRLNLASLTYEWERGWPPRTNITRGTFEDIKQLRVVKSYSKARGAMYYYVQLVWRRRIIQFPFGYSLLGQYRSRWAAEELARDCADRLGVPLVLKTAPPPETWMDKKLW